MPWRAGFLEGLRNSRKFLAIVSSAGLTAVRNPYVNHTHDNVLLEYQTALQISSHIDDASYVVPVFIGEYTDGMLKKFGDYDSALYPDQLEAMEKPDLSEWFPVDKGGKVCFKVPSDFPIPDAVSWTPREIMTDLFRVQGIALDPRDIDPGLRKIQGAIASNDADRFRSDGVTSYDVFLSYRVAADADLAEKIYLNLKLAGLNPFLDKKVCAWVGGQRMMAC